MKLLKFLSFVFSLIICWVFSCGPDPVDTTIVPYYNLGGTVTGLKGTVVLQNNGNDNLVITEDGAFVFGSLVEAQAAYEISILVEPSIQVCSALNNAGSVGDSSVTDVNITCITSTYTLSGTVSGMSGTLVLRNNGINEVTITNDGPFTFPDPEEDGSSYSVSVFSNPKSKTCVVSNRSGFISGNNIINISVICTVNTYTVGGGLIGLTYGTIDLQNNAELLSLDVDGAFNFSTLYVDDETYNVIIVNEPIGHTCSVANSTGIISESYVTTVIVTCEETGLNIGGTVTNLTGTLILQNNGTDDETIVANGVYVFTPLILNGESYNVTALSHPAGLFCKIINNTGTFAAAHVTNVDVDCITSGTPDVDFSTDGQVETSPTAFMNNGRALVIQTDDKIIVGGQNETASGTDVEWIFIRYNTDGGLDTSFGTAGITEKDWGAVSLNEEIRGLALQPNGKIVGAGVAVGADDDFGVVRLNTDGTLDTTFDSDGFLNTDISGNNDEAEDLVIQSNGKILLAGKTHNGTDFDVALTRYESNGFLDTSFGTGGIVKNIIGGLNEEIHGIVLLTSQKILIAGGDGFDVIILKLDTDGSLDTTFDLDGWLIIDLGATNMDLARDIILTSSGQFYICGEVDNGIDTDILVARFNSDGTLDTAFDIDGKAIIDITGNDIAFALIEQPDGKIVVAGQANGGLQYEVIRFNVDGSLDMDFDVDGKVDLTFGIEATARDVGLDSLGRIVTAGNLSTTNADIGVVRLLP